VNRGGLDITSLRKEERLSFWSMEGWERRGSELSRGKRADRGTEELISGESNSVTSVPRPSGRACKATCLRIGRAPPRCEGRLRKVKAQGGEIVNGKK